VAWMDGQSRSAGTGKAASGGSGGGGAWLTRRAVQARLGRRKGWEDGQADGPNRAKIASCQSSVAATEPIDGVCGVDIRRTRQTACWRRS